MRLDLDGPAGRLDALLDEPVRPEEASAKAPPAFAAIVCHPHPRFGGTMNNHATYRLAKAVRRRGGTALRFDFRGVGRSAGAFDGGRGETDDAVSALGWLAREMPSLPLLACGFSFGAWIAALAGGRDDRVHGLLLAGVALRAPDLAPLRDAARLREIEKPVAAIQAERDAFSSPDELRAALAGSRGPRRLAAIPGATHLFTEDLDALEREAEGALAWLLEARP